MPRKHDGDEGFILMPSYVTGRYALGAPDGPDISVGSPLAIYIGGHWIDGHVEHSSGSTATLVGNGTYCLTGVGERGGYYFVADGTMCGLCVGMRVRPRKGEPREAQ